MRDYRLYLKDILAALESVETFVGKMSFEEFRADQDWPGWRPLGSCTPSWRGIGGNLWGNFGKNVPRALQRLQNRRQNPIQMSKSNHHGKMQAFDRTKPLV